jgi:hypothetical protein
MLRRARNLNQNLRPPFISEPEKFDKLANRVESENVSVPVHGST